MANKVWESLLKGVKSAVELRIVTFIGEVEVQGDDQQGICNPKLSLPSGTCTAIVTCLNLVEGDVTSCFPEKYNTEDMTWVRDYHEKQVGVGKEIVDRNLRLIGELGTKLAEAIKELKGAEES
jgi:hypothetical protein